MKFPNAYEGIKKIFTSEILNIISAFCLVIAAGASAVALAGVISAGDVDSMNSAQTAAAAGGGIAAGIFGIAGAVIGVIAFILMLVGLNKARKDDPNFNIAFMFVFIGILCTIIGAFIPGVIGSIFKSIGSVSNLIITIYIILGIRSLAIQLGDSAVEQKTRTMFGILVAVYCLAIIASIISLFAVSVASIIALVSVVLNLIGYIIFLVLLAQAKKMLAA